jgi:hypothetical protein
MKWAASAVLLQSALRVLAAEREVHQRGERREGEADPQRVVTLHQAGPAIFHDEIM